MNERIKKLADNATYYANGVCDADANADWYETRDQKFAELIVKECADKISQEQDIAEQNWQCKNGLHICHELTKHFGLEE